MTRRTRTSMRYHGCTPIEAERIRSERERISRFFAWVAIGFVLASFAPPVWRVL